MNMVLITFITIITDITCSINLDIWNRMLSLIRFIQAINNTNLKFLFIWRESCRISDQHQNHQFSEALYHYFMNWFKSAEKFKVWQRFTLASVVHDLILYAKLFPRGSYVKQSSLTIFEFIKLFNKYSYIIIIWEYFKNSTNQNTLLAKTAMMNFRSAPNNEILYYHLMNSPYQLGLQRRFLSDFWGVKISLIYIFIKQYQQN